MPSNDGPRARGFKAKEKHLATLAKMGNLLSEV